MCTTCHHKTVVQNYNHLLVGPWRLPHILSVGPLGPSPHSTGLPGHCRRCPPGQTFQERGLTGQRLQSSNNPPKMWFPITLPTFWEGSELICPVFTGRGNTYGCEHFRISDWFSNINWKSSFLLPKCLLSDHPLPPSWAHSETISPNFKILLFFQIQRTEHVNHLF